MAGLVKGVAFQLNQRLDLAADPHQSDVMIQSHLDVTTLMQRNDHAQKQARFWRKIERSQRVWLVWALQRRDVTV